MSGHLNLLSELTSELKMKFLISTNSTSDFSQHMQCHQTQYQNLASCLNLTNFKFRFLSWTKGHIRFIYQILTNFDYLTNQIQILEPDIRFNVRCKSMNDKSICFSILEFQRWTNWNYKCITSPFYILKTIEDSVISEKSELSLMLFYEKHKKIHFGGKISMDQVVKRG